MHSIISLAAVSHGIDFSLSWQAAAAAVGGLAYGLLPDRFKKLQTMGLVTFGAGVLSFLMRV